MTHKAVILSGALWLVSCFLLTGCRPDTPFSASDLPECKVAVVLPFADNMKQHWQQCLNLCSDNQSRAFCRVEKGVRLVYEWYDENDPNLEQVAARLAQRSDITAVIGGLYSGNALKLASQLSKTDKPLFSLATTEQLVRAYSSWGNLWAMTETDITQCEVLLSKTIQYGAESVALIAQSGSAYGQTFTDWFAFQSQELGLENKGVYTYTTDVAVAAQQAMQSQADYIICAPSAISDIPPILTASGEVKGKRPHLLFSDIGHGNNVIEQLQNRAEGIEGVCFGSDPESGFDVAYEVRFGMQPTVGEAQVYDAAMMIGYAALIQQLYGGNFKDAMHRLVDGRETVDAGWRSEDMARVADEIKHGQHPDIKGASGKLDFDAKVYTNVLHTTYDNYLVYQQRYVYLDYNSTDGSRRTDPTLAEWNWKASQMQDVTGTDTRIYPDLDERWALLVASSQGWENYRHQVDVLDIYQTLKQHGYQDDHIVLVIEDDLAQHPSNPDKGKLYTRMNGVNVYHDLEIDYHPSDLNPADLTAILTGQQSVHLPQVLHPDSDDNIVLFWSGHGFPESLYWLEDQWGLSTNDWNACLKTIAQGGNYRKMFGFMETCYSGSIAKVADQYPGMLFMTAANENETSKADEYNYQWNIWMSNRFTATLEDCLKDHPDMSFRDLYYRLFQSTVGSHVCIYGVEGYGNIYTSYLNEIYD